MSGLLRTAALWLLCMEAGFGFDWNVRRFEGRDYVSANRVAEFYSLPSTGKVIKGSLALAKGRRSLLISKGSRAIEINGVNYTLSFAVIERDGKLWVSRMDLGNTIEPAFRPEAVGGIPRFTTVVLDPGHGGHDSGAVGPYETEKNFALDVARRVRDLLKKQGLHVVMTRNSDVFVDLHDRAERANSVKNSIFVSLHFNASPNRNATGLEIFSVTPRGAPSTEYDELLVRDMVQENGNENAVQSFTLAHSIYHCLQGSGLEMFDRGVKRARFAVLRLTKMPAVLVEGGFLSNRVDARQVAGTDWRNRYADAIATGILEYKNLGEKKVAPRLAADYRNGTQRNAAKVVSLPSPTPSASSMVLRDLPGEIRNH